MEIKQYTPESKKTNESKKNKREILKKDHEPNENGNRTLKTDGIRKANVKGKFIAINANNKKLEKSQINNLTYIEAVEKMNK